MQHCIQTFISKENAGTLHFKRESERSKEKASVQTFISKEKASVGVAALPGASACKLWQERREQRC
jgi:hypothetical protein